MIPRRGGLFERNYAAGAAARSESGGRTVVRSAGAKAAEQHELDIQQILTAQEIGIRWGDNVGPVVTFDYRAALCPIEVLVPLREPPLAVAWCSCQDVNVPSSGIEGNARVRWSWLAGAIRIHNIDVTNTSHTYKVTLGILKG